MVDEDSTGQSSGEAAHEEHLGIGYQLIFIVLEINLGILVSGIVMRVSPRRELRGDAGRACLAGRHEMIAALEPLQSTQGASQVPERVAAFGISGGGKSGWARLFCTHPELEDRIAGLRANVASTASRIVRWARGTVTMPEHALAPGYEPAAEGFG